MSHQIKGTITNIENEAKKVSDTFSVRAFAIQTDGQYPQPIKFQLTQDRCDLIDSFSIGSYVNVFFDLRGKKMDDGRIFNNINAWKIEGLSPEQSTPTSNLAEPRKAEGMGVEANGDLPF